jgi:uncharacterized protein YqhQ
MKIDERVIISSSCLANDAQLTHQPADKISTVHHEQGENFPLLLFVFFIFIFFSLVIKNQRYQVSIFMSKIKIIL